MHKVTFAAFVLSCSTLVSGQPDRTLSHPMEGPRRMALVIGNNAYPWGRLTNATNDARSLATTLESVGFERQNITLKVDVNLRDMQRAIRMFVESVRSGDLAFVYYSGHGVEVRGKNYLLPVDFPSDSSELEVADDAYSAQELVDKLDSSGARVKLIVLDACRDNPLPVTKRSISRGLGRMESDDGKLIMFSTSAGKTATDSGVFEHELARGLQTPGISVDNAFRDVARNVYRATDGKQFPVTYGLLLEDFAFVPGYVAGDVRTNPKDGQRYAYIPPGTFRMGCSAGDIECDDDEKPARDVKLTHGFWLGQTEVTVEAYRRYTQATGQAMPAEPKLKDRALNPGWRDGKMPIVEVTWDESKSYCEWMGGRLPTEAEWEYAARAGTAGPRYGAVGDIAWYGDNSGKVSIDTTAIRKTGKLEDRAFENENSFHRVALKTPNGFGLYDMLGNVGQFVADWFEEEYYSSVETTDPQGPPNGVWKVARGGAWIARSTDVRASARERVPLSERNPIGGIRCAWE